MNAFLLKYFALGEILKGGAIDPSRDLDALLLVSPTFGSLDPTVVVLRHRLSDAEIQAALAQAARVNGQELSWCRADGTSVAGRRAVIGSDDMDEGKVGRRLIAFPAPHLALITKVGRQESPCSDSIVGPDDDARWSAVLRLVDLDDSFLPPDIVATISLQELAADKESPPANHPPESTGMVGGLPHPQAIVLMFGIVPQPFVDMDANFSDGSDAVRWAEKWPMFQETLLRDPLVMASGSSSLPGRAAIKGDGTSIHIHLEATEAEATNMLGYVASRGAQQ